MGNANRDNLNPNPAVSDRSVTLPQRLHLMHCGVMLLIRRSPQSEQECPRATDKEGRDLLKREV